MIIKTKLLAVASFIIVLGLYGLGFTESESPYVFRYELSKPKTKSMHSVTFKHSTHAMEYKITCLRCHHELEEGAVAVEERCVDCHEDTELKSYKEFRGISGEERQEHYILMMHDQCINCHKEIKTHYQNSMAPVACWGCHVRKKK